jgi:predicted AAA+ superfamily ATPase
VLIDEYQHVPDLLDAIKAELNRDLSPGRFVLAGSTRYSTLPQAGQALTGRVDILDVLPLAQAEIDGQTGDLLVHQLLGGVDVPERFAQSTWYWSVTTALSSRSRSRRERGSTVPIWPVSERCVPG